MLTNKPIKGMQGTHGSLWIHTSAETDLPYLPGDASFDVAIIGGGLTGLTAAYLLKKAGRKVIVLEKDRVAQGTTGHSTAKVTSAHGMIYRPLVSHFGKDLAKIYAGANQWAIGWMNDLVKERNLDCDFRRIDAFTFAETDQERRELDPEMEAAESLGLPVYFCDTPALPFSTKGAIGFRDQALFHPRKYLLGLLDSIRGDGSFIYENTMATAVNDGDPCEVKTDRGTIKAECVIVATMYPFIMEGAFFTKLYPKQSYVIAAAVNNGIPEGMFYSAGEYGTTIRPHPYDNGQIVVFGGDSHKVGQGGDIVEHYRALEKKLRESFDVRSIEYYWTTHDALSMDGVPYIGKAGSKAQNVYVATGFKQWGITHAAVAARILSDLIQGRENDWLQLYDATRVKPMASAKEFIRENANVGKELIKGWFSRPSGGLEKLEKDTAASIEKGKQKIGVYKNDDGSLHGVSRICTHMGCQAVWDNAERTWDCPCHGSRYSYTGDVIYGPTAKDLKKEEVKEEAPV